jgi:uracil-DNA glycosylase
VRVVVTAENGPEARFDRATGDETWESLTAEIRACTLCRLSKTRTQAVVYRGGLAPRVVFVGEAPGAAEDLSGVPFVGRSGQRLDAAIATAGLARDEVGILNVVKCRPPGNRFDVVAERTCRPYLDRQLAWLRPLALIPVGARALRAVAPDAPPILQSAGAPLSPRSPAIFPLIHPAAAMRSRRLAERWVRDVDTFRAWIPTLASQPV